MAVDHINSLELAQVTVLHRHGARTPVPTSIPYVNQLNLSFKSCALSLFLDGDLPKMHINKSLIQSLELGSQLLMVEQDSCFFGQLTDSGKSSLYNLGRSFRDVYCNNKSFLPERYDPADVELRSTNYVRTIESLQRMYSICYLILDLLHGLYPKEHRPHGFWNINIHEHDKETMTVNFCDFIIIIIATCPILVREIKELRTTLLEKHKTQIHQTLKDFRKINLTDQFAENRLDQRVYRLFDVFISMQGNHIALPDGITHEHVNNLGKTLVNVWSSYFYYRAGLYYGSESISKKTIGRFLPEWTHNISEAQAGRNHKRLSIFSGHDTTIQPLLGAMQTHINEYPGYASNVLIVNS
jgi:acid phosphatase